MTMPNSICEKAKVYYYDYLMKQDIELIPAEIAEHLEQCKRCKLQVELLSKELEHVDSGKNAEVNSAVVTNLRLHFAYADKPVGCKIVRPFLPGLVDKTLRVGIPTPITVHLDNCEKCEAEFERIKSLGLGQKELFKLAQTIAKEPETQESGVITCYKIKEEADAGALLTNQDTPYEQWPIEVEVSRELREVGLVGAASGTEKHRLDLRPFVRPILAVAAVVLIALFVVHSNTAKAIGLGQVYKAFQKANNICLTSFALEREEPIQKIWVSRDLNVKIGKTGASWVLWDLDGKIQKSKDTITGTVETKSIDEESVLRVSKSMSKTLELLPFVSMPEALNADSNARWQKANEKEIDIKIANTQIYDLTWTERITGKEAIGKKFRLYVDAKTYLPKRIEEWVKYSTDIEYKLAKFKEITYSTSVEVGEIIRKAGF